MFIVVVLKKIIHWKVSFWFPWQSVWQEGQILEARKLQQRESWVMCPQLLFLFIFFPLEPFVVLWSDALKSLMHLVQNVFKSDLTRNLSQTRFVIFALVILLILACPFQWDLWWKTVCPSLLRPFLRPVSLFSCVNQPLHKDIPFWGDLSWDLSLYFPALINPSTKTSPFEVTFLETCLFIFLH